MRHFQVFIIIMIGCVVNTGSALYSTTMVQKLITNWLEKSKPGSDAVFLYSLATSLYFLGCLLGGLLFTELSTKYGRKINMLISTSVNCLGLILMSIAPLNAINSIELFIVGRVIAGFALGGLGVTVIVYISEITPLLKRGAYTAVSMPAHLVGSLIVMILQMDQIMGKDDLWNYVLLICTAFSLPFFITYKWIPNSPPYLRSQGRDQEALEAVKQLFGPNSTFESCKLDFDSVKTQQTSSWDEVDPTAQKPKHPIKEILTNKTLSKACLYIAILVSFTVVTGPITLSLYSRDIIEKFGFGNLSNQLLTLVLPIVRIIASLIGSYVCMKFSRRGTLIWSFSIIGVSISLLTLFGKLSENGHGETFDILNYILILMIMAVFNIGVHTILTFIIGIECLPVKYKAIGSFIYCCICWPGLVIVNFVYPLILRDIGVYVFLIFGGFNLVSLLFIYFRMMESKDRPSMVNFSEFEKRGYF